MKIKIRHADDSGVVVEMTRKTLSEITGLNFNDGYYSNYRRASDYIGKELDISKRCNEIDVADTVKRARLCIYQEIEKIKNIMDKQEWIFEEKVES